MICTPATAGMIIVPSTGMPSACP